jgi:hypothetical protein
MVIDREAVKPLAVEAARQMSTLRPSSRERERSSSEPTSGEANSALSMPPFFGGLPDVACLIGMRLAPRAGFEPATNRLTEGCGCNFVQ